MVHAFQARIFYFSFPPCPPLQWWILHGPLEQGLRAGFRTDGNFNIYVIYVFFCGGSTVLKWGLGRHSLGNKIKQKKQSLKWFWYFSNATANSMPHRVRFLSNQIPQKEIDFEVIYQILDYLRLFSYFQTLSGVSKNYQNLIKMKSKFMLRFWNVR